MLISVIRVFKIATPDFRPSKDYNLSPDRLSYPLDDVLCVVCMHILNQAVESPCSQLLFCVECTWMWLNASSQCPSGRHRLLASDLVALHPRVRGILAQIQVSCDFVSTERLGGTSRVQVCSLKLHVTGCAFRPGAAPHSPLRKVLTLSSGVEDILTSFLSKLRGDVAKKVTAHLLQA